MEELFSFAVLRPPRPVSRGAVIVFPVTLTLLRRNLFAALNMDEPRRRMIEAAEAFLASEEFSREPATQELAEPLLRLMRAVEALDSLSLASLERTIHEIFDMTPLRVRESARFTAARERAFDAVLALWIRPRAHPRLLSEYVELVRAMDLVDRVARRDPTLEHAGPNDVLERTIVLPVGLFPLPRSSQPSPPPVQDRRPQIERLEIRGRSLARAAEALTGLSAVDIAIVEGMPRVTPEAVARLPTDVREALREVNIDAQALPLSSAVERIEHELRGVTEESTALAAEQAREGVPRTVTRGTTVLPAMHRIDDLAAPEGPSVPPGSGPVRPAGFVSLMKVLQQIKRYEAGEIAHVENVMQSEKRTRETRRLRRSEETFLTEQERSVEQERDEQTTERDEMQAEVGHTLSEREKFNIGASISAGYGPVKVSMNSAFESEMAEEETRRTASTFAREVTEKTAERVRERTREQRSRTTIEEFEEKYHHGFDNTEGEEHINGIFRWLVKVYEMEVRRYGERLMFEFEVPEPAALLSQAVTMQQGSEVEKLKPPEAFLLRPDQLTVANYTTFVHTYQATGVEPPPPASITVSVTMESRSQSGEGDTITAAPAVAKDVDIPSGYRAIGAYVNSAGVLIEPNPDEDSPFGIPSISVQVGRRFVINLAGEMLTPLDLESGPNAQNLPVVASANAYQSFVVGVGILCSRTSEALDAWKLRTHELITQAYLKMEAEYQERLATLVAQQGVRIQGRNPLENERIIRTELQRAAITMITGQHFDHFSAILQGSGLPRIDIDEAMAEGPYVAFLSTAFEWEHMTYVFQPYFWGRKSFWLERLVAEDPDPLFLAFVRAGYARVQVPVRPGFNRAVQAFLDTGEIPEGEPEGLTSPEYLPIVEELKGSLGVADPGELVDSFEVRLPTTLHVLQTTDALPEWERTEDGTWIPRPANAEDGP